MNKNIIYYHIFTINNWVEIVNEQFDLLKKSNLFDHSLIKVGILYIHIKDVDIAKTLFDEYDNVEIILIKPNTDVGESETLIKLKEYSTNCDENRNVLYIHTKGVTQYSSVRELPVKKWRNMMEYFLIEKWEDCVNKLNEGYECCGVNYQNHAGNIKGETTLIKIFNGNFFWTKTDYVKKLDESILFEHRYSAENWISSSNPNTFSFYDTPITIDLYYQINENYK
jgi:hypothetical protein